MGLPKIKEMLDVRFIDFKGTLYVTKQMAARFYRLLQGDELKEFKQSFGQEIDFPTKTTILGVFDFRSFQATPKAVCGMGFAVWMGLCRYHC